jgi:hypothetical protein
MVVILARENLGVMVGKDISKLRTYYNNSNLEMVYFEDKIVVGVSIKIEATPQT